MKSKIIEVALKEYATAEIVGVKHNPRILDYLKFIGHPEIHDDETAWCSTFANFVCKTAGAKFSGKLNARSWLTVGVETKTPEIGDVVVFWRGSKDGWEGHVSFFIRQVGDVIYCLGGNQSNQVNISAYPKAQVLGYRNVA